MRVLVVEDERSLNELITKRLKLERYVVDSCYDGTDALSYIECAEYDAIVLDVMI
ncbi:MAG: response regulator, partial [Clostridia bacterium]|nr:response regulator [Clostridia bacterium]